MTKVKYKTSIVIRHPIGEVFEVIATGFFENRPKWAPEILRSEQLPAGATGVGTLARDLTEDRWGRRLQAEYKVTEYEPPFRFAYEGVSRFAEEQPTRQIPPAYKQAATPFAAALDFAPHPNGTQVIFTNEVDYRDRLGFFHRLTLPIWMNSTKEQSRVRAYRLRDYVESQAGLPTRRRPVRIRRIWVFWGIYFFIFAALFWLYSARNDLALATNSIELLRSILSGMVALAFTIAVFIGIFGGRR